jgi:hypothetical protein
MTLALTRVEADTATIVLLFEPRRLAEIDPYVDPKAPELMAAIPNLLTVIRNLARRSEGIKQLVRDSASPVGLILISSSISRLSTDCYGSTVPNF